MTVPPVSETVPAWCPACAKPIPGDALFCDGCGADLASPLAMLGRLPATPGLQDDAPLSYASFWQRLAAHLIDQAALFAFAWFVGRPLGEMLGAFAVVTGSSPIREVSSYLGALLMAAFASFVFEVIWTSSDLQATPGKRALGLKVTDRHGRPLGFAHAFGRYLSKGLSSSVFCIGFLIQPFTARKQAMHDLLAGTLVVNR